MRLLRWPCRRLPAGNRPMLTLARAAALCLLLSAFLAVGRLGTDAEPLTQDPLVVADVGSEQARRFAAEAVVRQLARSLAGSAGQEAPQFRSRVELVQFQVGVADMDGDFVPGLTAEDFLVDVDGQSRPVQVAYEVDLRGASPVFGTEGETARQLTVQELASAARRRFLLLLDHRFTPRAGVLRARRAAGEFLRDGLLEGDLVGVATADHLGLVLHIPFTDRHQAVAAALADTSAGSDLPAVEETAPPVEDADMAAIMSGSFAASRERDIRQYLQNLEELGRYLGDIEGRKHVLFLSPGFEDALVVGPGSEEIRAGMDGVVETFRRADAVLHAVDPTGLRTFDTALASDSGRPGEGSPSASVRDGHQSLLSLADGTGGLVRWSTNEIAEALASIQEATAAFYVIGYRRESTDPLASEVRVQVRAANVRIIWAPERTRSQPSPTDGGFGHE